MMGVYVNIVQFLSSSLLQNKKQELHDGDIC